jgi:predicted phosphodiesterase
MRFGLLSCVHANLPAFEAVLGDAQEQRCDSILCLGDLVGQFGRPNECVQLARTRCATAVKGNHDEYAATWSPLDGFTPEAAEVVDWTRSELSSVNKAWLNALPYRLEVHDFTIVHASLANPNRWPYIFERLAAAEHFNHQSSIVCFYGHTHVPVAFRLQHGQVAGGTYTKFTLRPGVKYVVNVGSVGQPRDGSGGAAYVIYDADGRTVELRRIDYPKPPSGDVGAGKPSGGGVGPPGALRAHNHFHSAFPFVAVCADCQ